MWKDWQANNELGTNTAGVGFDREIDHLLQEFSDESDEDPSNKNSIGAVMAATMAGLNDKEKLPEEIRSLQEMMSSQNKWTQEEIKEKLEKLQDQRKLKKLLQQDKLKDNMQNIREQRQKDHRAVINRRQKNSFFL